jgi:hypothetical protein
MKQALSLLLVLFSALPFADAMPKPSFHTNGSPTGKPTGPLKPGQYWWAPNVSPKGPVVVLVSVPLQVMHVYRNGVLVGRSTISTGTKGHATPSGVFTILEKKQTHYSKTYDNAPMPNMQRLTWNGIAMHSGNLPGYPASHGCIRMPYEFSKLLFTLTAKGGTVVIGHAETPRRGRLCMESRPQPFGPSHGSHQRRGPNALCLSKRSPHRARPNSNQRLRQARWARFFAARRRFRETELVGIQP